jgi:hypothetical protein
MWVNNVGGSDDKNVHLLVRRMTTARSGGQAQSDVGVQG